jgi:hypothetical protein
MKNDPKTKRQVRLAEAQPEIKISKTSGLPTSRDTLKHFPRALFNYMAIHGLVMY